MADSLCLIDNGTITNSSSSSSNSNSIKENQTIILINNCSNKSDNDNCKNIATSNKTSDQLLLLYANSNRNSDTSSSVNNHSNNSGDNKNTKAFFINNSGSGQLLCSTNKFVNSSSLSLPLPSTSSISVSPVQIVASQVDDHHSALDATNSSTERGGVVTLYNAITKPPISSSSSLSQTKNSNVNNMSKTMTTAKKRCTTTASSTSKDNDVVIVTSSDVDQSHYHTTTESSSVHHIGDDGRKKRCADRYDSSESSDSGVAQLSCTDCSACSSSSTASSDITDDPGSPYSTGSSHGDDSTSTPAVTSSIDSPTTTSSNKTTLNLLNANGLSGIKKMPPHDKIINPSADVQSKTNFMNLTSTDVTKQPWPWDQVSDPGGGGLNNEKQLNYLKRVITTAKSTQSKRLKTNEKTISEIKLLGVATNKITSTDFLNQSTTVNNNILDKNKLSSIGNSGNLTNARSKQLSKTLCPILPKPIVSLPSISTSFHNLVATNAVQQSAPAITQRLQVTATQQRYTNKQTNATTTKMVKTRANGAGNSNALTINSSVPDLLSSGITQQGKITEYFKAQVKPPAISSKKDSLSMPVAAIKTDLNKCNKIHQSIKRNKNQQNLSSVTAKIDLLKQQQSGDLKKYLELFTTYNNGDGDKKLTGLVDGTTNPVELFRKIDVRTLTLQNQIKTMKMDAKLNGKVNPVVSLTRKILPKPTSAPQSTTTTTTCTTSTSNQQQFDTANDELKTVNIKSLSNGIKLNLKATEVAKKNITANVQNLVPLIIPTSFNTAMPTVVTSKLGLQQTQPITTSLSNCQSMVKLNGTFIPIVKLNALPVKLNTTVIQTSSSNSTVSSNQPSSNLLFTSKSSTSLSHPTNLISPSISLTPISSTPVVTIDKFQTLSVDTALPTVPIVKSKSISPTINKNIVDNTTVSSAVSKNISNDSITAQISLDGLLQTKRPKEISSNSNKNNILSESVHENSSLVNDNNNLSIKNSDATVVLEKSTNNLFSVNNSDSSLNINNKLPPAVVTTSTTVETNITTTESQKSPILSQPKTIRFPPPRDLLNSSSEERRYENQCHWSECHIKFDTSGALLEHLQVAHIISQAAKETFVCLWIGCKVHGRISCSRSWLERHVLSHAGNKPYRCIVDGCGCRFNSQTALERHVNSHFNADGAPNTNNQRRSLENGCSKLLRKNGKKMRYRLQPWSARMFDFFDAGIMEGLQYNLINMTDIRTAGQVASTAGNMVTLRGQVIARRTELSGKRSCLLKWYPEKVIADEWVAESDVNLIKSVPIPGLEPSAINVLNTTLFPKNGSTKTHQNDSSSVKELEMNGIKRLATDNNIIHHNDELTYSPIVRNSNHNRRKRYSSASKYCRNNDNININDNSIT